MLDTVHVELYLDTTTAKSTFRAVHRRATSLKTLTIVDMSLQIEDFANVIDRVHNLELYGRCLFLPSPGFSTEEQLSAAFARTNTIHTLEFHLPQDISTSIFMGLRTSNSIVELSVRCDTRSEAHMPVPLRHAMELLFQDTQSLQKVTFWRYTVTIESFGVISQHIANSTSIKRIVFIRCHFDATCMEIIGTMFGPQSNSDSLLIEDYHGPELHTWVMEAAGQQFSLREFRISECVLCSNFTQEQFVEMLQVVENNEKLETFGIGTIFNADMALALTESIPRMHHLKHFEFHLDDELIAHPFVKPAFMRAFKENLNLLTVKHDPFFNEEDETELEAHFSRNCFWYSWYADPSSISLALLPRIAARASEHPMGPSALFQGLRGNTSKIVAFLESRPAALPAIPLETQVAEQREQICRLEEQNAMKQAEIDCLVAQTAVLQDRIRHLEKQDAVRQAQIAEVSRKRRSDSEELDSDHDSHA